MKIRTSEKYGFLGRADFTLSYKGKTVDIDIVQESTGYNQYIMLFSWDGKEQKTLTSKTIMNRYLSEADKQLLPWNSESDIKTDLTLTQESEDE